jgi:hypothetical protein
MMRFLAVSGVCVALARRAGVTEVRSLLGALRTGHRGDVDRVAPPAPMIAPIQDEPDAWVTPWGA